MMRLVLLAVVVCSFAGCSGQAPRTLGVAVEGIPISIAAIQRAATESSVVIEGTMSKKCPVAGCWFVLQDESGTIKVDTRNAGFVVVDVPLHSRLSVAGRVGTNGTERFIDASGVRY